MKDAQILLKILASWRAWRDAQHTYAQAVEGGNKREIEARYVELQDAHRAYQKYNPRHTTRKGAQP